MPEFSERSKRILATCHEDIQAVFHEVIQHFDCTVISGHRGEEEQNENVRKGFSRVEFPNSRHNSIPSEAVDVVPYPIDWKDRERFHYFAGFVLGVAKMMDIDLRWGGDWDRDTEVKDNDFDDLPHFELSLFI